MSANTETKTISTDSKFDPKNLRLSQSFSAMTEVKKHILAIPVGKPNKQDFIRVRKDPAFRLETMVLEIKKGNETYIVHPSLHNQLVNDAIPKVILTTITMQGALSLWAIKLPDMDGKLDPWNSSAIEAASIAEDKWTRVYADMHNSNGYIAYEAMGDHPEPEWPDLTFQAILQTAFKDRFIESMDHPVLKKLRGEK